MNLIGRLSLLVFFNDFINIATMYHLRWEYGENNIPRISNAINAGEYLSKTSFSTSPK